MITLRNLTRWIGTPSCVACGSTGEVRIMAVDPRSGGGTSLVLCARCETSLGKKLDKRVQAASLKRLGIKSKPWSPDNDKD